MSYNSSGGSAGGPASPRRYFYCDPALVTYRSATPAFSRTARGAYAHDAPPAGTFNGCSSFAPGSTGPAATSQQNIHTLKGGSGAYKHFKFGFISGTRHYSDSEAAMRGPYGWTKERQEKMDRRAEEETARAGVRAAAADASLQAASLGYGATREDSRAYLAMDRPPRQALPRAHTTFYRTSRATGAPLDNSAAGSQHLSLGFGGGGNCGDSGNGRFVTTASIPPPAQSAPSAGDAGTTARFPFSATAGAGAAGRSQRSQALAADRVDERLLQLPAATGYGDRHGAHPLHLRRPLDSDDFDGWAAGTHGTATAQAADADGLGATDRARARARALGAQMRPAGMSSEQIHVDAPMLRFSKSAGRGGAR